MKRNSFCFASALLLAANTSIAVPADSSKAGSGDAGRKHEISFGVNGLTDNMLPFLYWDYWYYYDPDYYYFWSNNDQAVPTYGLAYKYHTDKFAFRLGLNFNIYNNSFEETSSSSGPPYDDKVSNTFTKFGLRAGIEKKKDFNKTQCFTGADLFYELYSSDVEVVNSVSYREEYSFTKNSMGLAPLIGVRYSFNEMLSVSTETKLNIGIHKDKYSYSQIDPSPYFQNMKGGGMFMKLSPLGQISVNIHF